MTLLLLYSTGTPAPSGSLTGSGASGSLAPPGTTSASAAQVRLPRLQTRTSLENRNRLGVLFGDQSRSVTMGPSDPRHRRGAQSVQELAARYHPGQFITDSAGRLVVVLTNDVVLTAADPVNRPEASATTADNAASIARIITALEDAGLMKRGEQ